MATDFFGKELTEGDRVVYAVGSGSSGGTLREGIFLRASDKGYVSVRAVRGHSGPYSRIKWLDTRTGRFVDREYHRTVVSHWIHKETREVLTDKNLHPYIYTTLGSFYSGGSRKGNPDYIPDGLREYVPDQYADYLMEIKLPYGNVSVLPHSKNVVKLDGLPR